MIRCIVIDDEALAIELLEDNIKRVPFLEHVRSFTNGFDALDFLSKEKIDLIFLDIRMPGISGMQLIKVLPNQPMIILTTAYEKYAVEGFEMNVLDYLLKPFSYERFLKAVSKARRRYQLINPAETKTEKGETDAGPAFIFVKADYKQVKINVADIRFIEGLRDYVKIYVEDRPVITQISLKAIEEKLPKQYFIRVHRSFIINLRYIQYIQRMQIRIGTTDIPIGENYREQFFKTINQDSFPL